MNSSDEIAAERHSGERRRSWGLAAAVVLATCCALLVPLADGARTAWVACLLDFGHIPLFAVLTFALWRAMRRRIGPALLMSAGFAGLLEVAQAAVGRTVDFSDFLRGLLGAMLAAVCLHLVQRPRTVRRVIVSCGLLVLGMIWPVSEAAPVVIDAYRQHQTFPVLCDFRQAADVERWYLQDASLNRIKLPEEQGTWAGAFDCTPPEWGTGGGTLFPAIRDWSGYQKVCFEFSFAGDPVHFLISVRDGRKVVPPAQRFDLKQRLKPGRHRIEIDLAELARGGRFAPLDLTQIESVHFMATGLEHHRRIVLDRMYLR